MSFVSRTASVGKGRGEGSPLVSALILTFSQREKEPFGTRSYSVTDENRVGIETEPELAEIANAGFVSEPLCMANYMTVIVVAEFARIQNYPPV